MHVGEIQAIVPFYGSGMKKLLDHVECRDVTR
jgi:hypothetical protein